MLDIADARIVVATLRMELVASGEVTDPGRKDILIRLIVNLIAGE